MKRKCHHCGREWECLADNLPEGITLRCLGQDIENSSLKALSDIGIARCICLFCWIKEGKRYFVEDRRSYARNVCYPLDEEALIIALMLS